MTFTFFLTTKLGPDYNLSSTNSFPLNQAVSPVLHQVFTHRGSHFFIVYEPKNKNADSNDRTNASLLPQVRGLVHTEGFRQPSNYLSIVQKSALDETQNTKTQERNRIQSQLTNFPLLWRILNVEGWIRFHRSIRDNELWTKPCTPLQAWIDMLFRATWEKSRKVTKRGIVIELQRGQFACSSRELASDWGWGKDKVIHFFDTLKNQTMIQTQENNVTTIVSILNYDQYQSNQTQNQTQTRHKPDTEFSDYRQKVHSNGVTQNRFFNTNEEERKEIKKGSLSEKSREPEAEPAPVRAKAKLVI